MFHIRSMTFWYTSDFICSWLISRLLTRCCYNFRKLKLIPETRWQINENHLPRPSFWYRDNYNICCKLDTSFHTLLNSLHANQQYKSGLNSIHTLTWYVAIQNTTDQQLCKYVLSPVFHHLFSLTLYPWYSTNYLLIFTNYSILVLWNRKISGQGKLK